MLSLTELKNRFPEFCVPDSDRPVEFFHFGEFSSSPEDLWPFFSDTSKFNRALGLKPRKVEEKNGRLTIEDTILGLKQAWVEEPWNWEKNSFMSMTRSYTVGCARLCKAVIYLEPISYGTDSGTRVYIYFGWLPSSHFWRLLLSVSLDHFLKKAFMDTFAQLRDFLVKKSSNHAPSQATPFIQKFKPTVEGIEKLESARKKLLEQKISGQVLTTLNNHILYGDEFEVQQLKLKGLARQWDMPFEQLLKAGLHYVREGVLQMTWDVICPHCRGSRGRAQSLADIPAKAMCTVCDVDFDTNDENSIEIVFRINSQVRKVTNAEYCAAEPAKKKHIIFQWALGAGASHAFSIRLNQGTHRVRVQGENKQLLFLASTNATGKLVELQRGQQENSASEVNTSCTIKIHNDQEKPMIFVCEELWWTRDSIKPSDIFRLQEFRDIFSKEFLSSGVQLALGVQTILFTDIVKSTHYYETRGDAMAFERIQKHFSEIFAQIQQHEGVVVKTIGDAVMGAFPAPLLALRAAQKIQEIYPITAPEECLKIRISIHSGPVMAVQLNVGIDYFGKTVNRAAKLQGPLGAGDIAISEECFLEASKFDQTLTHQPHSNEEIKIDGADTPFKFYRLNSARKLKLVA